MLQAIGLDFTKTEVFNDAFMGEYMSIWGATKFQNELSNLCFHRAFSCMFGRGQNDIAHRRRLLYCYLKPDFEYKKPTDTINALYRVLPTDSSIVRRAVRNLATLYKQRATRTFGENNKYGDLLSPHYRNIEAKLKQAYRIAKLSNVVAVRPVWRLGEMQFDIYAPDQLRVVTSDEDFLIAREVWLPVWQRAKDGSMQVHFQVWNEEIYYETDVHGMKMPGTEVRNEFGEIPYVFLRLEEGDDFWGGGLWELVLAQLDINKLRLLIDQNITYGAFAVWLFQNFGIKGDIALSPNKIFTVDGLKNDPGGLMPPAAETISPESHYDRLTDIEAARIKRALKAEGLPESIASENPQFPPSGLALSIEGREMHNMREEDISILSVFEEELANKVSLILSKSARKPAPAQYFPVLVNFAEQQIFLEVKDEYEYYLQRFEKGHISVLEFVRWASDDETITNEQDAIAWLKKNQETLSKLSQSISNDGKEAVNQGGGGEQTEPEAPQQGEDTENPKG